MKGIINFIVNDNRQKIAIANIQIHILTSILSSLGGPKQPKKVEWFLSWDMKVEPKKHFNCLKTESNKTLTLLISWLIHFNR